LEWSSIWQEAKKGSSGGTGGPSLVCQAKGRNFVSRKRKKGNFGGEGPKKGTPNRLLHTKKLALTRD